MVKCEKFTFSSCQHTLKPCRHRVAFWHSFLSGQGTGSNSLGKGLGRFAPKTPRSRVERLAHFVSPAGRLRDLSNIHDDVMFWRIRWALIVCALHHFATPHYVRTQIPTPIPPTGPAAQRTNHAHAKHDGSSRGRRAARHLRTAWRLGLCAKCVHTIAHLHIHHH